MLSVSTLAEDSFRFISYLFLDCLEWGTHIVKIIDQFIGSII